MSIRFKLYKVTESYYCNDSTDYMFMLFFFRYFLPNRLLFKKN
jgi:hypothetical protein